MLRYSYKVELKRAVAELVGLQLDLERARPKDLKRIEERIKIKEKQIKWLEDNQGLVPEPYIL